MKFTLTLLVAAGFALPALAQETPTDKPAEETAAPKDAKEEAKICKRVASGMDSRRKERVCLTPAEWRAFNNQ